MKVADPYTLFAKVYDQEEHGEITTAFLAQATPVIAARPEGTPVLDLACGTGIMAGMLADAGVSVIGVDRSEEMLAIARKRCRGKGVRFVRADMRKFTLPEPCTVATICGDVPNHLTLPVLRAGLRRTRTQLAPGGVVMFDSLRRFCFEQYWDRTYHFEGPDGDIVMECDWNPRERVGTARIVGYAKQPNGEFTKFETELLEHFYTEAEIRGTLKDAGFHKIRAEHWSPWDDQHLEPEMDRLFWTAERR